MTQQESVTLTLSIPEAALLSDILAIGNSIVVGAGFAIGDVRGQQELAGHLKLIDQVEYAENQHPMYTLFSKMLNVVDYVRNAMPLPGQVEAQEVRDAIEELTSHREIGT